MEIPSSSEEEEEKEVEGGVLSPISPLKPSNTSETADFVTPMDKEENQSQA